MSENSEFGHFGTIYKGDLCIDSWGAGPFLLTVAAKTHRFEDSDRFGPNRCKANGDPCANPWWSSRHPFWRAHWCWRQQGRRLANDGLTCLWDNIEPEISTVLNRRGEKLLVTIDPYDHKIRIVGSVPLPGDHP